MTSKAVWIPGDVDFVARKMRVDKKQGAQLIVTGPKKGDLYIIIMSNLIRRETDEDGIQAPFGQFVMEGETPEPVMTTGPEPSS